jgi:hypothetical protein
MISGKKEADRIRDYEVEKQIEGKAIERPKILKRAMMHRVKNVAKGKQRADRALESRKLFDWLSKHRLPYYRRIKNG